MAKRSGAIHVARVVRKYKDREYVSHLLRRSYREGGKVRHETLGNVSALPEATIEVIRQSLAGKAHLVAGEGFEITRSLPHGHVAAVVEMARGLGFPGLLGPAGAERDLAFALVVARVCRPGSKLATTRWWADTTLAVDVGLSGVTTDDVYAAMDRLYARQGDIEATLARRHLTAGGLVLYDLSSSWMEGAHCPLAARGYSRDGKTGRAQIEYGLVTDPEGRPVAVEVFPGNTGDPTAFRAAVGAVRERFGLGDVVLVGDRGMITSARIEALKALGGLGWVTALRAPAIATLAADGGPLQLSLFDETNLAEITHPDYPGERLVACRNPALATERARKRVELLAATEVELAKVATAVEAGRLSEPAKIGLRAGRVVNRYKVAKHFELDIGEGRFTYRRKEAAIDAEAALDGIYVIRTSVSAATLSTPQVVEAYKRLAGVERDFRSLKTVDLDLRPIFHRLEDRVRAHVFVCMLAAYIVWHLRRAWAPITFTDEAPPSRDDPVAPARRSPSAQAKASRRRTTHGETAHSFGSLLDHLATLTRNEVRAGENTIEILATPTALQRQAFELIGSTIPYKLM
ncbi:MAG: IS1634 family transposase [Acidimicrobiia bacterium]